MTAETRFHTEVLPLKDKLFRLALHITLHREDAEDMVQETLLRLWRILQTGREVDNAEALALTVCRNLCLDFADKAARRGHVSVDDSQWDSVPLAVTPDPSQRMEHEEQRAELTRLLASLPEKQRTAFELRDVEGHAYREIADIMQISESDVKVNIFRARNKLRERLAQWRDNISAAKKE